MVVQQIPTDITTRTRSKRRRVEKLVSVTTMSAIAMRQQERDESPVRTSDADISLGSSDVEFNRKNVERAETLVNEDFNSKIVPYIKEKSHTYYQQIKITKQSATK